MSKKRKFLIWAGALCTGFLLWLLWTENDPEGDKSLRVWIREQVKQQMPQSTAHALAEYGIKSRIQNMDAEYRVLLVHGLDDSGGLWDDLVEKLNAYSVAVDELRYPNDQPISESAKLMARELTLTDKRKTIIISHSMGGLVTREFLTSPEFEYVESTHNYPPVVGFAMLGTPNHGSEWARFRVWLELKDAAVRIANGRMRLLSGLMDGAGEAKIDLRPGSEFLNTLNARPMPETIDYLLIGGEFASEQDWDGIAKDMRKAIPEIEPYLDEFKLDYMQTTEHIGDGVVTLDSLKLEGLPEPIIVNASHRMMVKSLIPGAPAPLAIAPTLQWVQKWLSESVPPSVYSE